jgi:hypothetical protein
MLKNILYIVTDMKKNEITDFDIDREFNKRWDKLAAKFNPDDPYTK